MRMPGTRISHGGVNLIGPCPCVDKEQKKVTRHRRHVEALDLAVLDGEIGEMKQLISDLETR